MMIFLFTALSINVRSQTNTTEKKQVFETQMNAYITQHLNEKTENIKQNARNYEEFDNFTQEDIEAIAREQAKTEYIHKHMKEYLNTYFSNPQAMVNTDTFICDNGGFEEDFLYYQGWTAEGYTHGSQNCTPNVTFVPTPTLPVTNRLEIVTSGVDPLVGIQKTKFGNKALRINNRYGHISNCAGSRGVDKITKEFKVTNENRNFTVWYALILENPANHDNEQPFFNIKCDLAPGTDLCFDPDFLDCDEKYYDNICSFDSIDVLDWACHRIKIPESFIDSIATLEITVGDCGQSGHFGYAYIDGICEECDTNSTLGSINLDENIDYISCYGDLATVCGTYTSPKVCEKYWSPFEITVPGYDIFNLEIDTVTKTFCFDFPRYNFYSPYEECLEIYAKIVFTSGENSYTPPQFSNSIELCKNLYEEIDYNVVVSECYDNGTNGNNGTDNNLSDDYYYVYLDIHSTNGEEWTIERQLEDPYPNEDDTQVIATGTGDTSIILGPFLIQEGDWWLTVDMPSCFYDDFIEAPDYCSGCDKFYEAEIGNVRCDEFDPTKWDFDIFVPGDNTKMYFLDNTNGGNNGTPPFYYGNTYTITGIQLTQECLEYEIFETQDCKSKFTICPPKPCDVDCDLQVETDIDCYTDENNDVFYYVNLEVSGAGQNQHYCYSTTEAPYGSPPSINDNTGSPLTYNPITGSYTIGFFTADIYLTIYLCDNGVDCSQNCNDCFKTIYIPKPDCERQKEIERGGKGKEGEKLIWNNNWGTKEAKINDQGKLIVVPNPFSTNIIILKSDIESTEFEIFNSSGQSIKKGSFKGSEYILNLEISQGLYLVRYKNSKGQPAFVKMIKL